MKRLIITIYCIAAVYFITPAAVFGGGKSDKGDSTNSDPGTPITTTTGQRNQSGAETNINDAQIVATVQIAPNVVQESIFLGQLKIEVERMERAAGRTLTQNERTQVLDVMINERLALQAADRERITITENELNQQMQTMRTAMAETIGRQPTDAEFAQAITSESGLDIQTFRDQLRRQMIVQKYMMAKKEDQFRNIRTPTEEEIRNQFNLNRSRFVRPETLRFTGIQVAYGEDTSSRTRARELADQLLREIGTSASRFDEVVTRGQSANLGYTAGDGGFVPRHPEAQNRYGPDFIETAFSLNQGEVSKVIQGTAGFMIIKVTENHAQRNLELEDFISIGARVTVREYIGNAILQEMQQAALTRASQELVAELRAGGRSFQINERYLTW